MDAEKIKQGVSMDKSLLVSVVVPIYNQERYLNKSIPSIINQTYENLDIILVNDGSTDTSINIVKEYAKKDSRIQVIEKGNGGVVDATLEGIFAAKGDLLCFMDPDDLLGENFVKTFVESFTDECDFVSAGFYYDNKGVLSPYRLKEDRIFTKEELLKKRDSFLVDDNSNDISNCFFIARWNKMYRTSLVKKAAEEFSVCKDVTLGDDTILVYLILNYASGAKTISAPNSYFYNIGNENSITKSSQSEIQLVKCLNAFEKLFDFIRKHNSDISQAYALYYILVQGVITRTKNSNKIEYKKAVRTVKKDRNYQMAKKYMKLRKRPFKTIVKDFLRGRLIGLVLKWALNTARAFKRRSIFLIEKLVKKGPVRAVRLLKFQINRENAYKDMNSKLPVIEKRILSFLEPFLSEKTNLDECSIEKNIFVFWWDGFENAPQIVKKCFDSVCKYHPDSKVIGIDKNNYQNFTDIHPEIIKDFEKDKISVQTFSDILRFNLLKNNGGIWIDSTILFLSEFNLFEDLKDKSFTSLEFSTTRDFLKYENYECSWSIFLMASRKNGILVRAVDEIYKKYYLKYKKYSIYFFTDTVLMICKKYGLDDNVLDKTLKISDNMFTLAWLLAEKYDSDIIEMVKNTPQKLRWNVNDITDDNTFCAWILRE